MIDRSLARADARRKARVDERRMKSISKNNSSATFENQPPSESFRKNKVLEILNLRNDSIRIEQERKERLATMKKDFEGFAKSEAKDKEEKNQKKFCEDVFGEKRKKEIRKKRVNSDIDMLRQHLVSRNIIQEEGE